MTSEFNLSPSDAHPETMDFLSLAWCNFAVQALKPEPQHGSLVLLDNPMNQFEPSSPMSQPTVSPQPLEKFNLYSKFIILCHVTFIFYQPTHFHSCFKQLHDMKKSVGMDDADFMSIPPLKSNNDLKVRYHIKETNTDTRYDNDTYTSSQFIVMLYFFSHGYGCSKLCILN